MSFHQPSVWFLLLLLFLPLIWWRMRAGRTRAALAFSSIEPAQFIRPSWATRWRWIVPVLRIAALAILIVAMARPQKGDEQTRVRTEGIAIQLVVDRSGSMRAQDFTINDRPADRLTVVKRVVEEFVVGGEGLPGRTNDMIGMIAFASFADSVCPITSDHGHLVESIRQTRVASQREESGTAIGDAIALGVERLRTLETRLDSANPIKSKIMILLTDGENNAGDIDPLTAANMAAAFDIRVYTIGAGTRDGRAPVGQTDLFGSPIMIPVSIDEDTLTKIAQTTGGRYFRATDSASLREIYEQIDQLERTTINEQRYVSYTEAAVTSVRWGWLWLPPLVPIALVALALEVWLASTRFRVSP